MKRISLIVVALFLFTVYGKTRLAADGALALPAVPSELKQPKDRANYIVGHFWDAMDWSDTIYGRNGAWLEQQLVNYLSVFPHAGVDSVERSVNVLLTSAQADKVAYELLDELAAGYLFNSDSPMRNDEFYIMFLMHKAASPIVTDGARERAVWMLEELNKNRVGHVAADFKFVTSDGRLLSVSDIKTDKDILLLFYDPDCSTCHEVIAELKSAPRNVTVVAICVEGERDEWRKDALTMPSEWIVGYPEDAVDELYALFEMPTMLLLDSSRVVKQTAVQLKTMN